MLIFAMLSFLPRNDEFFVFLQGCKNRDFSAKTLRKDRKKQKNIKKKKRNHKPEKERDRRQRTKHTGKTTEPGQKKRKKKTENQTHGGTHRAGEQQTNDARPKNTTANAKLARTRHTQTPEKRRKRAWGHSR